MILAPLIGQIDGPYFIETSVDFTGGTSYTEIGTSQLISVPYALHAATAGNVPENVSDLVNDTGFITSADDADADPSNELQTWATLPGIPAEFADGTDAVDDADNDPANEIQVIVSMDPGNSLSAGGDGGAFLASVADADWTISGTDQYSAVDGNVGIGTTTPDEKLDVQGVIRVSESVNDEMVINNDDVWAHGTGDQDFGDGGDHFMIASRETSFESAGIYGDGDHVTIWSPGDGAPGQPSALLYVNDEDGYNSADTDPFNGTALKAYLNTAGNWVAVSDLTRKENVVELEGSLEKLAELNGYSYNFKLSQEEIKKGDQPVVTYGVVAQEVYEVFPELIDIADDGSYYVCYTKFVPILIEAVNEQQTLISTYETTVEEVKAENETIKAENEALKVRLEAFEERLKALEEK